MYMKYAIEHLHQVGQSVTDADIVPLTPLDYAHFNVLGHCTLVGEKKSTGMGGMTPAE